MFNFYWLLLLYYFTNNFVILDAPVIEPVSAKLKKESDSFFAEFGLGDGDSKEQSPGIFVEISIKLVIM